MADELERVRISAAELRAEASSFNTHGDDVKDLREEGKKQRQRDSKRPDLQFYKPGVGHPNRRKDSAEGAGSDTVIQPDGFGNDPKMPDNCPTSPGCSYFPGTGNEDYLNDHSKPETNHKTDGHIGDKKHKLVDVNAVKIIERAGTPKSPKQSRKMRKPDRQIYQPGGRRSQGNKEAGASKELDRDRSREEEVDGISVETPSKCEKEEKRKNRRGKNDRKKQASVETPSANKTEVAVENISPESETHIEPLYQEQGFSP